MKHQYFSVKTKGVKISRCPEEYYETVCAKVSMERKPISKEKITLFSYGNAKLRMTEIPKKYQKLFKKGLSLFE